MPFIEDFWPLTALIEGNERSRSLSQGYGRGSIHGLEFRAFNGRYRVQGLISKST